MSRKVEQGEATRDALVTAAVDLFTEKGFADTATSEIVRRAGVTRGALYHHFADKEELFRAAFVDIEKDIHARCEAAVDGGDLVSDLQAAVAVFLDACLEPAVQRVLLRDGPLVLGWERSLRFDDPHCARLLLLATLRRAVRSGLLAEQPVEPLAHLLYGALTQAGIVIANADDPAAQRAAMGGAVARLVDSLFER